MTPDNDRGQLDPMIMPSPGHEGAFMCAQCRSRHISVSVIQEDGLAIRLACPVCLNYLDFALEAEHVRDNN